jgi:hypothetical protein
MEGQQAAMESMEFGLQIEKIEPVSVSFVELIRRVNMDLATLSYDPDTGATLDLEFDIAPEDFLSFAEKDILEGDLRGLVNGLSNAKRAIDCQVEKLLACLGLPSARSFPKKMELLAEIGVVAPRIVAKVVRARNYLEHEYRRPEREQVEDAVDVATLFVAALERSLAFFPESFSVANLVEGLEIAPGIPLPQKGISLHFNSEQRCFDVSGYVYDVDVSNRKRIQIFHGSSILKTADRGYRELIRLCFILDKSVDPEDKIRKYLVFICGA